MLRTLFAVVLALMFCSPLALAEPFWGDTESRPVETPPSKLKPGQFIWKGGAVPVGPIVVVVSLPEQRAYVYRNGIRIGVSSASTGKPGHSTPTGVFMVLQKDKDHRSRKYNNAPMPYTQRLTWDGVALHAGGLPGYPSSHGCIHLPSEFASRLFKVSPMGMTVVIANQHNKPTEVVHPAVLSPVDARGEVVKVPRLSAAEAFRWRPEASPKGPVSILISRADQRVLVYRNGVEIGRAKLAISQPGQPFGTHAFIMQDGWGEGNSPIAKDARAHVWVAVGIPGHANEHGQTLNASHQVERVHMPSAFAKALYDILTPGTTLLVTDAAVLEHKTTGVELNIINADMPKAMNPNRQSTQYLF
ncbi:MAG: L,D-transpeptidase [Candidatus Methylumidiphilus sp.]